jgi:hypothetical protein
MHTGSAQNESPLKRVNRCHLRGKVAGFKSGGVQPKLRRSLPACNSRREYDPPSVRLVCGKVSVSPHDCPVGSFDVAKEKSLFFNACPVLRGIIMGTRDEGIRTGRDSQGELAHRRSISAHHAAQDRQGNSSGDTDDGTDSQSWHHAAQVRRDNRQAAADKRVKGNGNRVHGVNLA